MSLNLSTNTGPSGNRILKLNWGSSDAGAACAATSTTPAKGEKPTGRKAAKRAQIESDLTWLCARWPHAFDRMKPMPLAIGIGDFVIAPAENDGRDRQQILRALRFYCSSLKYLRALSREGAMRVGVDGVEIEPVSAEHAAHARDRAAAIERRWKGERDVQAAHAEPGDDAFSCARAHETARPQIRSEAKP